VLQNPSFYGWGALQAYLPEKDLAIAASATLEKEAKVGLNGARWSSKRSPPRSHRATRLDPDTTDTHFSCGFGRT
jgi:hypothetical protein